MVWRTDDELKNSITCSVDCGSCQMPPVNRHPQPPGYERNSSNETLLQESIRALPLPLIWVLSCSRAKEKTHANLHGKFNKNMEKKLSKAKGKEKLACGAERVQPLIWFAARSHYIFFLEKAKLYLLERVMYRWLLNLHQSQITLGKKYYVSYSTEYTRQHICSYPYEPAWNYL